MNGFGAHRDDECQQTDDETDDDLSHGLTSFVDSYPHLTSPYEGEGYALPL